MLGWFPRRAAGLFIALATVALPDSGQELAPSGAYGLTYVYATDAGSTTSQLYLIDGQAAAAVTVGQRVSGVPSRWAHRRRTLGALETRITYAPPLVLLTPFGNAPGNGAIHMIDYRIGTPPAEHLEATGHPAAYDLVVVPAGKFVFSAEDDGSGGTLLRGYSYQTPGDLDPLNPATLTLPGPPSAYVNRIELDDSQTRLYVPTSTGVQVVDLAGEAPQMSLGAFHSTAPATPVTNVLSFDRNGTSTWIVGTAAFDPNDDPTDAGFLCWDAAGATESASFGTVPSAPAKNWVPAAGAEELAVVSDGTDTYVYSLLREPGPGTFFIKGAAVGVIRFLGSSSAATGTLLCTDEGGEPFANPTASGTRVAFETSFGPPFVSAPADGGERVCVIYSPLDPLGASTTDGLLAIPGALGGRISTKGMDRPLWSADGSRVFAATSWFPGAPNVGMPGLEVLDVPAGVVLNTFVSPHTVVPTPGSPDRSIVFPSLFAPRFTTPLTPFFSGVSFVGHVANDGLGALMAAPFGEVGQKQLLTPEPVQSPNVPNFRAILPPTFDDPLGASVIPGDFGARRTTFNVFPQLGVFGLSMIAADGDRILVQPTFYETAAALGLVGSVGHGEVGLAAGWTTTTEFLSL